MQAAFILRKAINARMCLSHPLNLPWPPLKFSSRPPALLQTSPSLPVLPTTRRYYYTVHCHDHHLLFQDRPPAAGAVMPEENKIVCVSWVFWGGFFGIFI